MSREEAIKLLKDETKTKEFWFCPKCNVEINPAQVTNTGHCEKCGTFLDYNIIDKDNILKAIELLESEPEPTIGSDSLREIAEQTWPVSNAAKRHLMHMADEFDSLIAELKAKDEEIQDLAGRMIFKGNSVSYIYQKMSSYRNHIGVAGNILRKHGLIEEFEQALKGEK